MGNKIDAHTHLKIRMIWGEKMAWLICVVGKYIRDSFADLACCKSHCCDTKTTTQLHVYRRPGTCWMFLVCILIDQLEPAKNIWKKSSKSPLHLPCHFIGLLSDICWLVITVMLLWPVLGWKWCKFCGGIKRKKRVFCYEHIAEYP